MPEPGCTPASSTYVAEPDLVAAITAREVQRPRWVFDEVALRYPALVGPRVCGWNGATTCSCAT